MNGHFDIGELGAWRYFFTVAAVLGLLFAMMVPAQTGFAMHVLQWQLQAHIPMALLVASHCLLGRWAWFAKLNPFAALALSGTLGAAAFAPIAQLLDMLFVGDALDGRSFVMVCAREFTGMAPPVVVSWLAMNVPWLLGYRLVGEQVISECAQEPVVHVPEAEVGQNNLGQAVVSDTPVLTAPAFVGLLPVMIRGPVVMLKAELHYLKVVTEKGEALILYSLKDAITELGPTLGIQTHRSYWVAHAYVVSLQVCGRQGQVTLKTGESVPVSRSQMPLVSARYE